MADVRIQISEFRWFYLSSEFCILTSAIFVFYRDALHRRARAQHAYCLTSSRHQLDLPRKISLHRP
jgi:hypothetical protein